MSIFKLMSKVQHKIWLIGLILFFSQSSFALSLGEIKVISTFAQPFLAEIKLPSYTEDEMESIEIHLASKKQFEEQNIEMLPVLRKFHFSVEEKNNGTLYIKVHTKTPVKELSLSFLIEVTWTGGHIIKSYDVLLTPEAITEFWEKRANELVAELNAEIAASETDIITPPVQQPVLNIAHKENPVIRQQPTQTASLKKKKKNRASHRLKKTGINGIEYSPVGRGESLSVIAQRVRPNKDMSINQVMVALFNENRHAFLNNDINRLLAGVTLKLEDTNSITSISKKEAMKLARQYMQGPDTETEPTLIANKEASDAIVDPEPEIIEPEGNRLEISSANEDPIPPEILQQIKTEQIASAEEELKIAQLNASNLISENNELKDRIAKLEEQLDSTAESLFLATIEQEIVKDAPEATSLTQQDQNLIVANTELGMEGDERLSLMQRIEKYQTAISISSATLLFTTLFGIRKKEQILNIVHNLKDKLNKPKDTEETQIS